MQLDPIANQMENIFTLGKILVITFGSKVVSGDIMVLLKKVFWSFYYVIIRRSMKKNSM